MADEPPPPIVIADPALLALPPLADGEVVRDSGDRACVKPEAPCPVMFGAMHKLLGHKDVRGRGSHVPAVTHCDPFVLCDAIRLPKGARPPFCAHPHSGVGVMTLLFQCAGGMRPWDNLNGPEAAPLLPGGVYHVDTGAGCVHDEPMDPLAASLPTMRANRRRRAGAAASPGAHAWLMQLWYNAMAMDGATTGSGVLAGAYRDAADGLRAAHPLVVLHVEVAKAGTLGPLPAGHNGGLWVLDGRLGAGDVELEFGAEGLCLLPPGGTALRLRNLGDAPAQALVALGAPHRRPYAKYVGYGGGFVHRDAAGVEAAMAEYERDPRHYGRAAAGATRAVDTSHLDLVGGFQDNGGPMLERPDGVVARFKNRGSSTDA
ncbi:quercetin 2,3-dioxygenase [Aureococcus anophagefferens]|nr:quercetin 2,3-dioxygenase [Aureococcus anophagefferens]